MASRVVPVTSPVQVQAPTPDGARAPDLISTVAAGAGQSGARRPGPGPRCARCPRLVELRGTRRREYPNDWNRPVPAAGPADARILIVGLAPGAQGANRTGVPFCGDSSGDTLREAMRATGLMPDRVRITNVVKCLPPGNRPTGDEVRNCASWFVRELRDLERTGGGVVVALGRVAHTAVVRELGARQVDMPFRHGAVYDAGSRGVLIDSYHCSQYNTSTRRLTPAMLRRVLRCAARLAGEHQ